MTKQPIPETTDRKSIESIERIAGVLADLSSELTELSSRLRSQTDDTEREAPGVDTATRTREPLAGPQERVPVQAAPGEQSPGEQSPGERALGEPVDTSFARPSRNPVATATGSAPAASDGSASGGGTSGRGGGFRLLAWVGSASGLLGLVVVVTVALAQGWYGRLAQFLAGALLGVALFAGALWLHHRSTGRAV